MATILDQGDPIKGGMGNVTYYQRGGKTIMRVRKNRRRKPVRTYQNMEQKTKWKNLLVAWRRMKGALRGLFEDKPDGWSDYNTFMSLNLPVSQVHLTEDEAKKDACVAESFVVSKGTLMPPVAVTMQQEWMLSDLTLGGETVEAGMSFYRFCAALFDANPGRLQSGDTIVFVRVTQATYPGWGVPNIEVSHSELHLALGYNGTLEDTLREQRVKEGFEVREGRLASHRRENSLVAWVVKRTDEHGHVQVTSQRLEGYNAVFEDYCSQEAKEQAIVSYDGFEPYNRYKYGSVDIEALRDELAQREYDRVHGQPPRKPRPTAEITTAAYPPEGGTASGAGTYEQGAAITLRATPAEGWRFHAWTDGNTLSERTVAVLAPQRYTALFLPDGV